MTICRRNDPKQQENSLKLSSKKQMPVPPHALPCTCLNVIANTFVLFIVPGVIKQLCTSWMTCFQLLYHGFHSNSFSFLYLGWRCWFAIKSHLEWGGLACRRQRGSLQLLCTSFGWPFLFFFIRILKAIFRKMGDLKNRRIQ